MAISIHLIFFLLTFDGFPVTAAHTHSVRHSAGLPEGPEPADGPSELLQIPWPLCLGHGLPACHHDRGGGEARPGDGGQEHPLHVSPRHPGQSVISIQAHIDGIIIECLQVVADRTQNDHRNQKVFVYEQESIGENLKISLIIHIEIPLSHLSGSYYDK